ncbi:MAG: hypothetical protein OSB41_00280 [Kiritimatiellae bacterium]|nr:hypothetical protein [Kiritimatiellia bacterium]
MNTKSYSEEDVWAYVHGETDADTRAALEAALQNDSTLAQAEKQIRATHTRLADGLQSNADNDEALTTRVLAAWERDQKPDLTLAPPSQHDDEQSRRKRPRLNIWHSGLAIAASLTIMMGIQTIRPRNAFTWTELAVPKARGSSNTPPLYSNAEMDTLHQQLVESVNLAYDNVSNDSKRASGWTLATSITPTQDQAFTLMVEARRRLAADTEQSWTSQFDNADDYRDHIDTFAAEIVGDLMRAL